MINLDFITECRRCHAVWDKRIEFHNCPLTYKTKIDVEESNFGLGPRGKGFCEWKRKYNWTDEECAKVESWIRDGTL